MTCLLQIVVGSPLCNCHPHAFRYHYLALVDEASLKHPDAENCLVVFLSKDAKREAGQEDRCLREYRLRLPSAAWGLTVLLSSLISCMASAAGTDVQASSSPDPDHGMDRIHPLRSHSSVPTPKFSMEVFLILNLTAI